VDEGEKPPNPLKGEKPASNAGVMDEGGRGRKEKDRCAQSRKTAALKVERREERGGPPTP